MQPEATRRQIALLRAQERDDAEAGVTRAVPTSRAIDQLVASCAFPHTGLSESSSEEDEAYSSRRSSGIGIQSRRLSLIGLPLSAAAHSVPELSESESDDEAAGVWCTLPSANKSTAPSVPANTAPTAADAGALEETPLADVGGSPALTGGASHFELWSAERAAELAFCQRQLNWPSVEPEQAAVDATAAETREASPDAGVAEAPSPAGDVGATGAAAARGAAACGRAAYTPGAGAFALRGLSGKPPCSLRPGDQCTGDALLATLP